MSLFLLLLIRLIPLYLTIFVGFIAGKVLHVPSDVIGRILIYIIAPFVIFTGTATIELQPSYLLLPAVLFITCSLISLTVFWLGRYFYKDSTRNIAAFTAGTGNTGYFGIPVAAALFGSESLGLIVLCTLGFVLYENTLGFYLTAKGQFSAKESLYKLLRLPTIYAFGLGLLVQAFHLFLPTELLDLLTNFKGAYSILGMMMVGLGIAGIHRFSPDLKFIAGTFFVKFLLWPLTMSILLGLDIIITHLFSSMVHKVLLLLSFVPLASNTVALASTFKLHVEKAALAVFLSTVVGLILIPFVFAFFS